MAAPGNGGPWEWRPDPGMELPDCFSRPGYFCLSLENGCDIPFPASLALCCDHFCRWHANVLCATRPSSMSLEGSNEENSAFQGTFKAELVTNHSSTNTASAHWVHFEENPLCSSAATLPCGCHSLLSSSRLDSLELDRCLSILFWLSACE